MDAAEISVIGSIAVLLFGVIHGLQNSRINKLEEKKSDKETCVTIHKSVDIQLKELKQKVEPVAEMKVMLEFLYKDKISWLKKNGHDVGGH